MDEQEATTALTALDVPEEGQTRAKLAAINRFQQLVQSALKRDHDYGIIPGTQKPTLLKPGAEKIAKLLGLADEYSILDKVEDWQSGFFRFILKCHLRHIQSGTVVSEGLGECNSRESKYRWRWVFGSDVPANIDKPALVKQVKHSRKTGKDFIMYRMENDDVYSQVNTILKMAKKRAMVDAALSAGRLSDMFTQDVEDFTQVGTEIEDEQPKPVQEEQAKPQPVPLSTASTIVAPDGGDIFPGEDKKQQAWNELVSICTTKNLLDSLTSRIGGQGLSIPTKDGKPDWSQPPKGITQESIDRLIKLAKAAK